MALTVTQANIVLGSRANTKQAVLGVPAGAGEAPGLLCLESVNAGGTTYARLYLWADSANSLRYSTTIPTDEDSDGSIIGTAAASSANTTLSNLAGTTAINDDLFPDSDADHSLGAAAKQWLATYSNYLYLNSTAVLDGSVAGAIAVTGAITLTGAFTVGVAGTGYDVTLYSDTAADYILWDQNGNTNKGALIFTGATDSPALQFTNTNVTTTFQTSTDVLAVTATDHANAKVTFGANGTNGLDVTFVGATSGSNLLFDAGANKLTFDDVTLTLMKTATAVGAFTTAANAAHYNGQTAGDSFNFGATTATDVLFHGTDAGRDALWDSSEDALYMKDNAFIRFGTDADMTIVGNNTTIEIDFAADDYVVNFGTTNQADLVLNGNDAGVDLLWDASKDSLSFLDSTKLGFGTGAAGVTDIVLAYTGGTAILNVGQGASGVGAITWGADNKGIDQTFFVETASSYIKLDQANDRLLAYIAKIDIGNATVTYDFALSTNSMVLSCTDNAGAKFIIGTSGTNGLDVTIQGAAAAEQVVYNAGTGTMTYQGKFYAAAQATATKTTATLAEGDMGKLLLVTADAQVLTLPTTAVGWTYWIMNGTDGQLLTITPDTGKKIMGAGLTSANDKSLLNTALTAKRGDYVKLVGDGASGWVVQEMVGTWARQA
jgi:hypothetical protein